MSFWRDIHGIFCLFSFLIQPLWFDGVRPVPPREIPTAPPHAPHLHYIYIYFIFCKLEFRSLLPHRSTFKLKTLTFTHLQLFFFFSFDTLLASQTAKLKEKKYTFHPHMHSCNKSAGRWFWSRGNFLIHHEQNLYF